MGGVRQVSIMVLTGMLLLLGVTPLVPQQVSGGPPQSGDWVVENTTAVKDEEIVLDGSLIVRGGGQLTLENVTLKIRADTGGSVGIQVKDVSGLTLRDSVIMPETSGKGYTFVVEGELVLDDSGVEGLWGQGDEEDEQGLIVNGELTMTRSWITSSKGTGLFLDGADALVDDSEIAGNGGIGVHIKGLTSPRIVRTNITGNGLHGLLIEERSSPEVLDCVIDDNGRNGVEVHDASPALAGNFITGNDGHGIYAKDSSGGVSLDGDVVTGNSGWGALSVRGQLTLEGVIFEDGGRKNTLGRWSQSWRLSVQVKGVDGGPKEGAEVSVMSNAGTTYGPVLSNVDGMAEFDNLVVARTGNNGTTIEEGPFKVTVALKDDGWSISKYMFVNLSSNHDLSVVIDLANLALSNLHVERETFAKGDEVEISVIVTNTGETAPGTFNVVFYDGTRPIGMKRVEGLDPGSSKEVSIKWKTGDIATGKHNVRVVADPQGTIPEISGTDNELSTKVTVEEGTLILYAVPILILIGVIGLAGFKIYNWVLLKRLERKQKEDQEDMVEFEEIKEKEEE